MIATIIIIALMFIDLGVNMAKQNERKNDRYNWWCTLIAIVIELVLFYFAGLFNNFK